MHPAKVGGPFNGGIWVIRAICADRLTVAVQKGIGEGISGIDRSFGRCFWHRGLVGHIVIVV